MQDIHTPINITIDPRVRAVINKGNKQYNQPFEVADIQYVIKAMSIYHNKLCEHIQLQENVIRREKEKLCKLDDTVKKMSTLLKENNIEYT